VSIDRALVIEASRGRGRLEIAPVEDRPDPEYFAATLTLDKLVASVHFYEPRGFSLGLGEFFASIANDWRGWTGEKTWESVEDELALRATHDGLGHVTVVAELRRTFDPPAREWLVRGALQLEAGALDAVARVAAGFERANLPDADGGQPPS